ncbi:MAG: hypothetical protein FJW20_14890 [Acidimicrobiia bacterium]|nr:hypothetical protein [Acidimicrobiia bacterium]
MRIDAQVQFCYRARFHYPWMQDSAPHMRRDFTPDDLRRILSRNRYEGVVASARFAGVEETDWLLETTATEDWILGVIGDGMKATAADLDRWQRHERFAGVWVELAGLTPELVRRGLPCDVYLKPEEWENLELLEEAASRTPMALANMGRPDYGRDFDRWARVIERAANIPGLMVKIAGLINDAAATGWKAETYRPYIQLLMSLFGPRRLMYSSDWPLCMHTGTWKESMAAFTQALGMQTIETRALLLGENAARFYRITLTDLK